MCLVKYRVGGCVCGRLRVVIWVVCHENLGHDILAGRERCGASRVSGGPGGALGALSDRHGGSILGSVTSDLGGPDLTGDRIEVRSSGPLEGTLVVPGAKNSVLKLMAAALLCDGTTRLTNVPRIADVDIMGDLLAHIGLRVSRPSPDRVELTNDGNITPEAPYRLVERIRASINVLGPLLGRYGRVVLSMPGGDDFGSRPIDMHVDGLRMMGAEFKFAHGELTATADRLRGARIVFDYPSVGATENIVMAAVTAEGDTVIDGAAREPEVVDLCRLLVSMGADISGIGTAELRIRGVGRDELRPAEHHTVSDRIQAATYIASVAVSGGHLTMLDARADDMEMFVRRCRDMGIEISAGTAMLGDREVPSMSVTSTGRLRAVDVQTLPYPGVATDYKPLIVTMLSVADGVGVVTENLYPGRFRYVEELMRLGADITTTGHHAAVRGRPRLSGAPVRAHDIRAGAAMVVAGLAAEGTTTITGVHHIDRGYDDLTGRLAGVGADIVRRHG